MTSGRFDYKFRFVPRLTEETAEASFPFFAIASLKQMR
jgi:hypothetical protein